MKKLYDVLNKIYGLMILVSFFGGIVPLVPYCVALVIGGTTGEAIALFLYKELYPWIIALGSLAVLVGLVCIYLKKWMDRKAAK